MIRTTAPLRALSGAVALALLSVVTLPAMLVGCSSSSTGSGMRPAATKPTMSTASATKGMSAVPTGATDPSVQVCAECAGKGKGAAVVGAAVVKNGVQVVGIAIKGGYYVPNKITVKAGMPVQVVFTGKAKGCIAKPTFKSLGKSGDLTNTGIATMDLGTLQPGSHAFTCAMGMGDGQIIVQ